MKDARGVACDGLGRLHDVEYEVDGASGLRTRYRRTMADDVIRVVESLQYSMGVDEIKASTGANFAKHRTRSRRCGLDC